MLLNGNLDSVDYNFRDGWVVQGWAVDLDDPFRPVEVEILEGETVLAAGVAEAFRQDLDAAGIRNGFAAFNVPLDVAALANEEDHRLWMRRLGTDAVIAPPMQFHLTRFIGTLERIEGIVIFGWACNTLNNAVPVMLEILLDDNIADRVVADQFRPDLADLGMGNARHGFRWAMPRPFIDGQSHRLAVRVSNTASVLTSKIKDVLVLPDRMTPRVRQLLQLRGSARQYLTGIEDALLAEGGAPAPAKILTATDLLLDSLDPAPVFDDDPAQSDAVPLTVTPEVVGFS